MTTIMKKITKGIVLNGESSDLTDNLEGTLFHNNSTSRIKSYIQGAVREVLTNSQSQVLTNKTIDVDSNTVSNIELDNLKSGVLNTSSTLASASDSQIPSALAVKTYTDTSSGTVQTNLGSHTGASTAVHGLGVGSSVVGTTDNQTLTTKTIDADNNTISNLEVDNLKSGVLNTSITLASASDTQIPSALAVKTYVDNNSGGGSAVALTVQINDNQSIPATAYTLNENTAAADISLTVQRLSTVSESELSAIDGTLPKYPDYSSNIYGVNSSIVQPDGKIIIAGSFISVGGDTNIRRLCRYNADYTLDTTFNNNIYPSAVNFEIKKVLLQTDGKILIAGNFINWAGVSGNHYLVRLNSDGTRDTAFCSQVQFSLSDIGVNDIALDSAGNIYVAGNFSNYRTALYGNGITHLLKLDSSGVVDTTWVNNAVRTGTTAKLSAVLYAVKVDSSDNIFIGGDFTNYTLTSRSRFAKIFSTGLIDATFTDTVSVNGASPSFSSNIRAIEFDGTNIYVGGNFTNYKGVSGVSRLIKVDSAGVEITPFTNNAVVSAGTAKFSNIIYAIKSDGSSVYIGGGFTNYAGTIGWRYIVKLSSIGVADTAWNDNQKIGLISKYATAGGSPAIYSLSFDSSNNLLVGGVFDSYKISDYNPYICSILLLASSGNPTSFIPYTTSKFGGAMTFAEVFDSTIQSDGKRIIVGTFVQYGGVSGRDFIVRLNEDNSVDTSFAANVDGKFPGPIASGVGIRRVIVQPDGKILLAGDFQSYNSVIGQDRLIRLNADGTSDTSFNSNVLSKFSAIVNDIALSGTSIIAGGSFLNWGGTTGKNYLIRLLSTGAEDTAFTTAAVWTSPTTAKFNAMVSSIVVQSTGNIILGGQFSAYAGTAGRQYLLGLTSAGALYTAFNTAAVDGSKLNSSVRQVKQLADGSILALGAFQNYNALSGANYLIKLAAVGTINTAFNTQIVNKFTSTINCVGESITGKIYVGEFNSLYNSITPFDICLLNSDGSFHSAIEIGTKYSGITGLKRIETNGSKMDLCGAFSVGSTGLNSFYQIVDIPKQGYKSKFQIFKTSTDTYTTSTADTLSDSLVGIVISISSSGQIQYTTTKLSTQVNTIKFLIDEFEF